MTPLTAEQKRSLLDAANRIRELADTHLGQTRRDWIERSYAVAIDSIHGGDGKTAIRALIVAVETAASDAGDDVLLARLSRELASVLQL